MAKITIKFWVDEIATKLTSAFPQLLVKNPSLPVDEFKGLITSTTARAWIKIETPDNLVNQIKLNEFHNRIIEMNRE